jgi:hypothetical protein
MTLPTIQPLLALDVVHLLYGLGALIFLIIRQIAEANRKAGVPRVPGPAMQKPPVQGGPAAAEVGQQADQLRAQVEEFLRRAGKPGQPTEPKPQQPKAKPKKAPADIQLRSKTAVPDEPRTIGQPLRQATWRNAPAQESTAAAADRTRAARTAAAQPRRRQSVAEHVAEQVSAHAQSLAAKAGQLGQRIAADDQQFDVQLRSKFDHTVGTLAGTAVPAAADPGASAPDTPAAQIAAMLREPAGIRQAVLVNEILRRPSERW